MKASIKELIVVHVCYRDVFNAPVSLKALKIWLGIRRENQLCFDTALAELKNERLIIEQQGYLACTTKEKIIQDQKQKAQLSKQIITRGQRGLRILSKIPFIKFVGISGSVAAENPTNNSNKNQIDLDLFVVTSKNTLWCFALLNIIRLNLKAFFKRPHFYCLNYITEDSFLEIYNKNFYTATELVNLKPIFDKGVLDKFISCNKWFESYYNKNSIKRDPEFTTCNPLCLRILTPVNYICFGLFVFLRTCKRLDLAAIREIKVSFNPNQSINMHRISSAHGGYQGAIKQRFEELFISNFKSYYSKELIEKLFPGRNSRQLVPDSHAQDLIKEKFYRKYTLKTEEKSFV